MTNKLKRTSKFLYALVFTILMVNCATEENQLDQNNNLGVIAAKNWFENNIDNYNDPILRYVKEFQWQNAILSDGENGQVIEIPFVLINNLIATTKQKNPLKDYHRLVLMQDENHKYIPFYVQVFTNDKSFDNLDPNFNYYSIKGNFDGSINVYDLVKQTGNSSQFQRGKKINPNITAKDDAYGLSCTYFGWWYEDGTFEEISLIGCSGGALVSPKPKGYGGGGAGSGGSNTPIVIEDMPPSCESFNFTTQKGSLWQLALVKNVSFKVVLVNDKGLEILHVIDYPQPISFGVPTNLEMGNTNVTSGIAANISARALQKSMQDVIDKFGRARVSELTVSLYFQERLKYNYPIFLPGGRVNFNATDNIVATNYKTNILTAGDCN